MNADTVMCPYHNIPARFRLSSAHLYRGFDYGSVWECPLADCDAYVGCHPDGRPLGRLANLQLRIAKRNAHEAFDRLWKGMAAQRMVYPEEPVINKKLQGVMRGRAYCWIADKMGIATEHAHIGMFDVEQCNAMIEIIATHMPSASTIRDWYKDHKHQLQSLER